MSVAISQLSIGVPADAAVNDIMISMVMSDQTITRPANYTAQKSGVIGGLNYDASTLVVKHADIGAASTWTFAQPSTQWASLWVLARNVTGLDGALSINQITTATPTFAATGVTTTNAGDLVLTYYLAMAECGLASFPTIPATWVVEATSFSRGGISTAFVGYLAGAAGPTGDFPMSFDTSTTGVAILAALIPAPAGAVIFEAGGTSG